ncbi:MAG TPA: hypothetical protein VMS87_09575 [Roseiarcus sp.]|nr:hypothetical protein [Roseiarcus sp.]
MRQWLVVIMVLLASAASAADIRIVAAGSLSGEKSATFDSNLRSIVSSPPNLNRFTKFSFQIRCASRVLAPM